MLNATLKYLATSYILIYTTCFREYNYRQKLGISLVSQKLPQTQFLNEGTLKTIYRSSFSPSTSTSESSSAILIISVQGYTEIKNLKNGKPTFNHRNYTDRGAIISGYRLRKYTNLNGVGIFVFTKNFSNLEISPFSFNREFSTYPILNSAIYGANSLSFRVNRSFTIEVVAVNFPPGVSHLLNRIKAAQSVHSSIISKSDAHILYYLGASNFESDFTLNLEQFKNLQKKGGLENHYIQRDLDSRNYNLFLKKLPNFFETNSSYRGLWAHDQLTWLKRSNSGFTPYNEEKRRFGPLDVVSSTTGKYDTKFVPFYGTHILTKPMSQNVKHVVGHSNYRSFLVSGISGIKSRGLAMKSEIDFEKLNNKVGLKDLQRKSELAVELKFENKFYDWVKETGRDDSEIKIEIVTANFHEYVRYVKVKKSDIKDTKVIIPRDILNRCFYSKLSTINFKVTITIMGKNGNTEGSVAGQLRYFVDVDSVNKNLPITGFYLSENTGTVIAVAVLVMR